VARPGTQVQVRDHSIPGMNAPESRYGGVSCRGTDQGAQHGAGEGKKDDEKPGGAGAESVHKLNVYCIVTSPATASRNRQPSFTTRGTAGLTGAPFSDGLFAVLEMPG
jgi:hypothetical protein